MMANPSFLRRYGLRNERLPAGDELFELYLWFSNERGYRRDTVIEDLKMLGNFIRTRKRSDFLRKE